MTGFIIFIIPLFLILGRWFRPKTIEHISAFSIALFYLICSLFAGTYYDARFMWIFFMLYMMPQTKLDMGKNVLLEKTKKLNP
jgi:hypothetical protein